VDNGLEGQISQWREYLIGRGAMGAGEVDELEDHLRTQVADLGEAGLSPDEAFLVAVKRMGSLDEISREFAREHSERLWKQLVLTTGTPAQGDRTARRNFWVMMGYALAAAAAIKVPALFGFQYASDGGFYVRNVGLLVLPLLAVYFAQKRRLGRQRLVWLGLSFVAAAVFANIYPFESGGSTELLVGLHLPIFLWLLVGFAYLGGDWRSGHRRMDFVRFTGEWFIYFVLIALGGGVLIAVLVATFAAIGIEAGQFVESWLVPCGAAGAVVVAAWLVEAKQSVIENMAPVLTRVFTPLFAAMFLASVVALIWTGNAIDVERDLLILLDVSLIVVLGLLLYSVSARDRTAPPTLSDYLQLVLVVSALVLDVLALAAMLSRISEFGFTPNRTAGLGMNLILAVNLGWSGWLSLGFLRTRRPMAALEKWQTGYMPAYAMWAAVVTVVFPPVFGYA
jgi:hypothetical protein